MTLAAFIVGLLVAAFGTVALIGSMDDVDRVTGCAVASLLVAVWVLTFSLLPGFW